MGEWARREASLVAFLAFAGALVALGGAAGIGWMKLAGFVVAVLTALVRLAVGLGRSRLEGKRETAVLDRRLRVPVADISEVDPTKVGIDAAAQSVLPGDQVPEYLPREIDESVDRAVDAALAGEGPWILIIVGPSKVGKSRVLFEALKRHGDVHSLAVVSPVDHEALHSLLMPGEEVQMQAGGAVLWLDDLEPFLNEGTSLQMLREWQAKEPGKRMVAATYGGKGSERIQGTASEDLATLAGEIFQHAREIPLKPTSGQEIAPLRDRLSEGSVGLIERHGLAAYLVAAPEIKRKLHSGRHSPGEPECPEGMAVIHAAVDWARCGRTDPVPREVLKSDLWSHYLPSGLAASEDMFQAGIEWGLKKVAGTVALLEEVEGYRAYDYVLRVMMAETEVDPPEAAWSAALEGIAGAQAFAVGISAYRQQEVDHAAVAFRIASEGDGEMAAIAAFNLGIVLGDLERMEESIAAYDLAVHRLAGAENGELLAVAAKAMFNKAVRYERMEKHEEAIAVFDELIDRFGGSEFEELEKLVAEARLNKGVQVGESGDLTAEIEVYDEVDELYSDSESPSLREEVARALFNKGVALMNHGDLADAGSAFEALDRRFGESSAKVVREQVGKGLVNLGSIMAREGRTEKAYELQESTAASYRDDADPELAQIGLKAMMNSSDLLVRMGRDGEAIAVMDDVAGRVPPEVEELQEILGDALLGKGLRLAVMDRYVEALEVFDEAILRLDADENDAESVNVAEAIFNRGVALSKLEQTEDSLSAYSLLAMRYGDSDDQRIRQTVAEGLINVGAIHARAEDHEKAIEVAEAALAHIGDDESLADQMASALLNKGASLLQVNRLPEAMVVLDELASRFADDRRPPIERMVQVASATRDQIAEVLRASEERSE